MSKIAKKISHAVSEFNRKRKLSYLLQFIDINDTIIDVGVAAIKNPPREFGTNYIEEYFNRANRNITALGIDNEDYSFFKERYANCELILFDGINFPQFTPKYNIAISNAVIEHVGNYETQLKWLQGLSSVSHQLLITTPNKWFPVEVHTRLLFLHWFNENIRRKLYRIFFVSKKSSTEMDELTLLSLRKLLEMLETAGFTILKIKKNKLLFFTMDFVIHCIVTRSNNII